MCKRCWMNRVFTTCSHSIHSTSQLYYSFPTFLFCLWVLMCQAWGWERSHLAPKSIFGSSYIVLVSPRYLSSALIFSTCMIWVDIGSERLPGGDCPPVCDLFQWKARANTFTCNSMEQTGSVKKWSSHNVSCIVLSLFLINVEISQNKNHYRNQNCHDFVATQKFM